VWAILACAAVLAAALELDRQSRRDEGLSALVPEPARHFAQFNLARDAVFAGEQSGYPLARSLLRRRPVPARNLEVFALAAAARGRLDEAAMAFSLGAARGWRARITQLVVADDAIAKGNWDIAFQRMVAVWSRGLRDRTVTDRMNAIVETSPGREAAAKWLAGSQRWQRYYTGWGTSALDPQAHVATVSRAVELGMSLNCADAGRALHNLLMRGAARPAERLSRLACSGTQSVAPGDLRFGMSQASQEDADPFAWRYLPGARIERGPDGRFVIEYERTDPGYTALARRFLLLEPGAYRIRISANMQENEAGIPLELGLSCAGGSMMRGQWRRISLHRTASIEIPEDCGVQSIELRAPRGAGRIVSLSFDPLGKRDEGAGN
jgi:hypothetical protein